MDVLCKMWILFAHMKMQTCSLTYHSESVYCVCISNMRCLRVRLHMHMSASTQVYMPEFIWMHWAVKACILKSICKLEFIALRWLCVYTLMNIEILPTCSLITV